MHMVESVELGDLVDLVDLVDGPGKSVYTWLADWGNILRCHSRCSLDYIYKEKSNHFLLGTNKFGVKGVLENK